MPPSELVRVGLVDLTLAFEILSTSEAASPSAVSGPKPGIAYLDVYCIGSRAVGEIQSGVQPELAGELVAKSDAPAADTLPICGGQ
jgi:hypothetical protein